MKILLISCAPPQGVNEFPSTGLLYLASVGRSRGHEVRYYDIGDRKNRGRFDPAVVLSFDPDIIGINAYTARMHDIAGLIRRIKAMNSSILTVVGGAHVSACGRETMEGEPSIDIAVDGEGEGTFGELLDRISGSSKKNFADIDGLIYRKDGTVVQNKPRELVTDLDSLPLPAYDLVDWQAYRGESLFRERNAAVYSSRGCPYRCIYCQQSIFGRTYRRRTPSSFVAEMKLLQEKYGIRAFYFFEDLFAVDKNWLDRFYVERKRQNVNGPWACLGRVDSLDERMLKDMRANGCRAVYMGVESGSQAILEDIGKNISIDRVVSAFSGARRAGLITGAYFMIGHRLDTKQTIDATIRLAERLRAPIVFFSLCVPFPGTGLYQYVPLDARYAWERYDENADNPVSVSMFAPSELVFAQRRAMLKTVGSLRYLCDNVLLCANSIFVRWLFFKRWLAARFPRLLVSSRTCGSGSSEPDNEFCAGRCR
ncbi:MAG: radical SAM protein [Candidatus Omnitrophica bacterium]|nr:radical SAM protein [Candidatus Omnitrophota bacterium]